MSGKVAPNTVKDGLVLYLDAANNKSIISGNTLWNNLSIGNYVGTLTNGATYSTNNLGYIGFNGSNNRVPTTFNLQLNDFTVGVWFKQTGLKIDYERIIDKSYQFGFWVGRFGTNANTWGGGIKDVSFPYGRYITLQDGVWHYIVSRRQGSTHTIYGDGITNTVSGTVTSTPLSSNIIQLGAEVLFNSSPFSGNISVVQVYNRALSDSEILQNYNSLKGRYL